MKYSFFSCSSSRFILRVLIGFVFLYFVGTGYSQDHLNIELYLQLGYGSIRHVTWEDERIYIDTTAGVWIHDVGISHDYTPLEPLQDIYLGRLIVSSHNNSKTRIVTEVTPGLAVVETINNPSIEENDVHAHIVHSGTLGSTAIDPSGNLLAVAREPQNGFILQSEDEFEIHLWNMETDRELHNFRGDGTYIAALEFSPDGEYLASAGYSGIVRIWDVSEGTQLYQLEGRQPLAFGNDRNTLFLTHEHSVLLFHLDTIDSSDIPFSTIQIDADITAIAVTSSYIGIGDSDGNIHLYDADITPISTWNAHSDAITSLEFDTENHRIVSSTSKELIIWDLESNSIITDLSQHFTLGVQDMGWINDETIVTTDRQTIHFWNLHNTLQQCTINTPLLFGDVAVGTDSLLWISDYHDLIRLTGCDDNPEESRFFVDDEIRAIETSPSVSRIAIARYGWIDIYDTNNNVHITRIEAHDEPINSIAFDSTGRLLASGSGIIPFDVIPAVTDNTVRVWDIVDDYQKAELFSNDSPVYSIIFLPENNTLVSGHHDGIIQVWDIENATVIKTLASTSAVGALEYYPKRGLLFSGHENGEIGIWDLENGTNIETLYHHYSPITALEVYTAGQYLAASSLDGVTSIWILPDE